MTTIAPSTTTEPVRSPAAARSLAQRRDPVAKKSRERRRALAHRARQAILLLLVIAAAAASVYALRPKPVPVDAARVTRGPLVVAIQETGKTRVKDRYVVSAPASGALLRLALEPGDSVKEGDTVAEIAPSTSPILDERTRAQAEGRLGAALAFEGQAQAQTSRARSAKARADLDLGRMRKLADAGAISADTLDQAEFDARMRNEELSSALFADKVAAEEVRVARVALADGKEGSAKGRHIDVVSPVSGKVLRVDQKSASVVNAGTPLLEIGDDTNIEVVVDLLTTDAVHIKPGTPASILGWGGDKVLAGRVRLVEPSAFTRVSALGVDEQRVNVVIAPTDPREDWAALGDQFGVDARFVLWESSDVLKVPLGAVFRRGDSWATYRVESGKSTLVPVELGHRGETEVEVVSGLPEGAVVAVHPGDRVKDGARVEPR